MTDRMSELALAVMAGSPIMAFAIKCVRSALSDRALVEQAVRDHPEWNLCVYTKGGE